MAEKKPRNTRIVYVEPNDAYMAVTQTQTGEEVRVPLTPPLEDMCISFNLTVHPFNRVKSKVGTGTTFFDQDNERQWFTLSWHVPASNDKQDKNDRTDKPFSFLSGARLGSDPNDMREYLTTYYTDIAYENYGNGQIVEGLGVESIQITFESWYTPTITIKFVDVRGSAIFGNEEALHNKKGELTAENIFGCFMTVPYPLFKLQVKGFLGHPVTYQLTCADCKFDYNPKTGNVEVVAQFIGYAYSLLTDIPIKYIVAAPYMTYVGRDYWDTHCTSPAWALDNGAQPPRLYEFFQEINAAVNMEADPSEGLSDEATQVANYTAEKTTLGDLLRAHEEFVTAFAKMFPGRYDNTEDDGHRQLVCFRKNQLKEGVEDTLFNDMQEKYRAFKTLHDNYNTDYSSTALGNELLPDMGLGRDKFASYDTDDSHHAFVMEYGDGQIRKKVDFFKLSESGKETNPQNIKDYKWGVSQLQLTEKNAQQLLKNGLRSPFDNVVDEWCYVLDLSTYASKIRTRIDELTNSSQTLQRDIDNEAESKFLEKIGFRPDIGNVFKIIMCHLETFVHVMMEATKSITTQANNNQRSVQSLGLGSIDNTDFRDDVVKVGPWPGVYGKSMSHNDTTLSNESDKALAWVGDFSDNFVEAEVVEGIFAAVVRLSEMQNQGNSNQPDANVFSFLPEDLNLVNPFIETRLNNSVANLAAQLAERAAALFGLYSSRNISDELASMLGRADAYNYFQATGSSAAISQDIFDRVGQNNLVDALVGIATCNPNYDSFGTTNETTGQTRFVFETDKPFAYGGMEKEERHPMLKANGNNFQFVHYGLDEYRNGSKSGTIAALPSQVRTNYKDKRPISFNEDHHEVDYKAQTTTIEPKSLLHAGNSAQILRCRSEVNPNGGQTVASDLREKYINRAMFNIVTEESKIQRIETIEANARSGSLKIGAYEASDNLSGLADKFWKVRNKDMVRFFAKESGQNYYRIASEIPNRIKIKEKFGEHADAAIPKVTLNDDGNWTVSDESQSKFAIPYTVVVSSDNADLTTSLLTHAFYYLQNEGSEKQKVKILLFLHSQWWNKEIMECFRNSNGCMEAVPYGYLLLLGGLLWRKRYASAHNGADPIKYSGSGPSKFKTNSADNTFFHVNDQNEWYPRFLNERATENYTVPIIQLFGGSLPDYNIENQLIKLFEDFVDSQYTTIAAYELTHNDNGSEKAPTSAQFAADWNKFSELLSETRTNPTYKEDTFEKGSKYIQNKMGGSWSQIWNKYGYCGRSVAENAVGLSLVLYYKEDDSIIQSLLASLLRKCIVCNATRQPLYQGNSNLDSNDITFSASIYRTYLNSFVNTLKTVVEQNTNGAIQESSGGNNGEDKKELREFRMAIYYYCKALWENWLVTINENAFDVDTFFKNNFIFIDSFYRNTYSQLPINCEKLVSIYNGSTDTSSLFSYIDHIVSEHRCIFFALPDYIGFQGDQSDEARMMDVFRPIPYQEQRKDLDISNKFVIIYTHKPSEHLKNDASEFRWDGFDIFGAYDKADPDEVLPNNPPSIFKTDVTKPNTSGDYHVPSFGVAVNRQNNTIFKNISLSNRNPVQTEAAIMALSNILERAKGRPGTVTFHGQDMYNVFSNYSYQTEIEMMGDAQIQPLMYFQLLNVPMWRGTYMIFHVQHTLTPGNMVTRFKGMKLCATPIPFITSYLTYLTPADKGGYGISSQGTGGNYSADGIYMPSSYTEITAKKDHYHEAENRGNVTDQAGNVKINPKLVSLFNDLYEEIEALGEGWNIYVSHAVRTSSDGNSDTSSQHYNGDAIDIQIKRDGKLRNREPSPELIKVIDMIYAIPKHRDICGQILLEYRNEKNDNKDNFFRTDNKKYLFNVLHIAVNSRHTNIPNNATRSQIEISISDKNGNSVASGDIFLDNVPMSYVAAASRAYRASGLPLVCKHFLDFGSCNQQKTIALFDSVSANNGVAFDRWWTWSKSWEGKKADESEIYGWTRTAENAYITSGGKSTDSVNTKAYNFFWKRNKCDQITDGNVAIMCMYTLYWTGNSSCIHFALDGKKNVNSATYSHCIGVGGSAPHGVLDANTIKRINEYPNQKELANRIKYHAGKLITTATTKDGTIYGVKYKGHLRRWTSINYTGLKMNNQVTTQPSLTEVSIKLTELWP